MEKQGLRILIFYIEQTIMTQNLREDCKMRILLASLNFLLLSKRTPSKSQPR